MTLHLFADYLEEAIEGRAMSSEGAALLDDLYGFLGRFVAYPSPAEQEAHTLWCAHAHLMDAWEMTPRLLFCSPEPGSGKTRALEITELVVPRPAEAVNVTPAYLFRKVADPEGRPTILFDEVDTIFGPRAKENEEIRGLLNAGHRKGARAGRCVVGNGPVKTEEIEAYCAVALAGLGDLPDTIMSRSVIVRMRRRAPTEKVEPYRRRLHASEGHELRDRMSQWAASVEEVAASKYPEMPDPICDRDADVWEPLLTVADLAGGEWPKRARVTAVTLVTASNASTPSLSILLLEDVRSVLGDRDALPTRVILEKLNAIEESPWGDLRGRPLDARGLARRLKPYGVESKAVRTGVDVAKGYRRDDFHDAWQRYLPPLASSPGESVTEVTLVTCARCNDEGCPWCKVPDGLA